MAKVIERCRTGGYPYEVFVTVVSHTEEEAKSILEGSLAACAKYGLKDLEFEVVDDGYKLKKLYPEGG